MAANPRPTTAALLLALGLMGAADARAAGFAVAEQGAASFGVAGAATARTDLAEAGFYNPAAWTWAPGPVVGLGVAAVLPTITHRDPASGAATEALTEAGTPPFGHAAYRLGPVALGVSALVPFGSALSWPEDWAGRHEITHIGLTIYEVAPTVAYRPIPQLAVSAGVRWLSADVAYERKIDTASPDEEGHVRLGAHSQTVGWQLSLLAEPLEALTLGLSWRSDARFDFMGGAHFEDIPIELSDRAHDAVARTTLVLPDRVALGAGYDLGFGLATLDIEYMRWSTFGEFAITFDDESVPDVAEPRDWHDTVALRLGYEHRDLVDDLRLRAGLAWDPTPSPTDTLSPSLPDGDRLVTTLGAGYALPFGLHLDAAYGHVFFMGAASTGEAFPGTYDASAHVWTVGLSYR